MIKVDRRESQERLELEQEEEYLGGFSSPHLVRGMMRGYELHATSKRLIGIKNRKAGGGWILAVGVGGAVGGAVAGGMSRDQSARTILELEQKQDFIVEKSHISQIEIKKPGTLTRGHIVISLKSAQPVEVKIADKKAYEHAIELMKKFYPNVLRVV